MEMSTLPTPATGVSFEGMAIIASSPTSPRDIEIMPAQMKRRRVWSSRDSGSQVVSSEEGSYSSSALGTTPPRRPSHDSRAANTQSLEPDAVSLDLDESLPAAHLKRASEPFYEEA